MRVHIISIFPESFESFQNSSMIKKAISEKLLFLRHYKLSDFSNKKFWHIDDKAYGMHGQVISPEPLAKAIEHVFEKVWKKIPIVYMSPGWELLQQASLEKYSQTLWDEFLILCGHYEWIDQRIINLYVDHQVSIGEYVLTSGELAAQVLIDGLVRFIPWVLWNSLSLKEDSFSETFDRQKEHPVYTRPQEFMWKKYNFKHFKSVI